jgi:hypothetical protein
MESLAQGKLCCSTLCGGESRHSIVHDGEADGDFARPGTGAIARAGKAVTMATLQSGMTRDTGIVEQGTYPAGFGTAIGQHEHLHGVVPSRRRSSQ